jgi:hypothetical protein
MTEDALNDEIALLQCMYPDEVTFDQKTSQFIFKRTNASLELRISNDYPSKSLPDLIAATGPRKRDLRAEVRQLIHVQQVGEPCLDAIITDFIDTFSSLTTKDDGKQPGPALHAEEQGNKTVIIWLHHLLATSKRKQALSPEGSDASLVRGVTKPGYPGVMIFSGPAAAVEGHVQALKRLRWQAFHVRHETIDAWSFVHGEGIIEVETMAEVVAELEGNGEQKNLFMEVMKIR